MKYSVSKKLISVLIVLIMAMGLFLSFSSDTYAATSKYIPSDVCQKMTDINIYFYGFYSYK